MCCMATLDAMCSQHKLNPVFVCALKFVLHGNARCHVFATKYSKSVYVLRGNARCHVFATSSAPAFYNVLRGNARCHVFATQMMSHHHQSTLRGNARCHVFATGTADNHHPLVGRWKNNLNLCCMATLDAMRPQRGYQNGACAAWQFATNIVKPTINTA